MFCQECGAKVLPGEVCGCSLTQEQLRERIARNREQLGRTHVLCPPRFLKRVICKGRSG